MTDQPLEQLTDQLQEWGYEDPEIDWVLVGQFGCLRYSTWELVYEREEFPVTRREEVIPDTSIDHSSLLEFPDEFEDALGHHPNVFSVDDLGTDDPPPSFTPVGDSALVRASLHHVKLRIPERHQEFAGHPHGLGDVIEEFSVITDGSLYCAYAEIDEFPVYPYIGQEYRELASNHIEDNTPYFVPTLGPTPLHPEFYWVSLSGWDEPDEIPVHKHKSGRGTPNVVVVRDGVSQRFAVASTLHYSQLDLRRFYALKMQQHLVRWEADEALNQFRRLVELNEKYHGVPWWNISRRVELARDTDTTLARIYKSVVDGQRRSTGVERQQSDFEADISDSGTLNPISDYLTDMINHRRYSLPESLISALPHFGRRASTTFSSRTLLITSIIGLIGVLIGSLITAMIG